MNVKEYALKNKIFVVILLVVTVTAIVFGFKKEGYHVDEMYSYGLANSEYLPFMHFGESGYDVKDWMNDYGTGESIGQFVQNMIKDFKIVSKAGFKVKETEIYAKYLEAQVNSADTLTSSWVKGSDYSDYINADKHNRFNYASVYYNQRGDVHPPLYYILLHTICSITEGHFTKWTGIGINILFSIFSLVFIYEMTKKYLGGIEYAIVATSIYGMSAGLMSVTVYIRMYALLALITMICVYLHLGIRDKKFALEKKDYLQLGCIVILGYLTHYYFVIFIIAMATVTVIITFINKKWKTAILYVITMFSAGVIGIVVWPFSIKHVFSGYRGNQAFASMQSAYSFYKLNWIVQTALGSVFGKLGIAIFIVVIIITIVSIIILRNKYPFSNMIMLMVPLVFTTIVVSQISPLYTDRYLMNVVPILVVIPVYAMSIFINALTVKNKNKKVNLQVIIPLVVFSVLVILFNNSLMHPVNNLYIGGQETVVINDNTDCVCVLPYGDWNEPAEDSMILAKCEKVGIVYENNIAVLKDGYKYKKGNELLVNISKSLDADETLKKVQEELGVTDLQEIKRSESAWCTRIWLSQ